MAKNEGTLVSNFVLIRKTLQIIFYSDCLRGWIQGGHTEKHAHDTVHDKIVTPTYL